MARRVDGNDCRWDEAGLRYRAMREIVFLVVFSVVASGVVRAQADSIPSDTLPRASLRPITVSAVRSEAPLRTVPYAVATVDGDELRRGRATLGLDEALVTVPGVLVANRYNYALDQRVSIRGFGARSAFGVRGIKILLDGIPQTLPDGQGQLTNIDLSQVGQIEILKGPSSSLHGNASGGVISLSSDLAIPGRVTPAVRVTAGAFDLLKWSAAAATPLGPGALYAAVSRTTVDGHRMHSRADVRHFQARVLQPVGQRTRVAALAYITDMPTAQSPGALTAAQFDSSVTLADPRNVNADAGKAVTQTLGGVSVSHATGGGGAVDVAIYGLRRDLENPLSFAFIDLDRWAYGVRGSAQLPFRAGGHTHTLTVGVDAQWQRDDRLNFTPDRDAVTLNQFERVFELGPFVQARIALGDRVTLTSGIRYDRIAFDLDDRFLSDGDASGDEVMDAVSWSGGITVDVHPTLVPYLGVASAFETPTTTELVNRPEGGGGLNPQLGPQRTVNVEAGVRGEAGIVTYNLAAFYADVQDGLIPFEVPSEPGRQFFRNVGASRHAGVEIGTTLRPHRALRLVGAYTFAEYQFTDFTTEDGTFDGNDIPGVPPHHLYVSLRYAAPVGLWAATDYTHTAAYAVDDENTAENAAWWTADVRVGWDGRIAGWRVAPYLGVLNLFDERYAGSIVVNAFGGRYFEPAPGRNLFVGAQVGR